MDARDTDAAPPGPTRTCVACRRRSPASEMLRMSLDGSDRLMASAGRHRLPGRGAWLCPRPTCAARAAERGGFGRALRRTAANVAPAVAVAVARAGVAERVAIALRGAKRAGSLFGDELPQPSGETLSELLSGCHEEPLSEARYEALESALKSALGAARWGAAEPKQSGVTHPQWGARIQRRLRALLAYVRAERQWASRPSKGRRRRGRGDAK